MVRARGVFVLREKLKGLKACLKEWNHNHFGNIHNNIVKIEKEMNELNKKEESVGLSLVELEIRFRELFMHVEGISTPRARHKGWQPLIECAKT